MDATPVLFGLPVAALALALAWQPWRAAAEPAPTPLRGALVALAVIGAAFVAFARVQGGALPELPPERPHDWLLWGGAALVPLGFAAGTGARRALGHAALVALAWAVVLVFATGPLRGRGWLEGGGWLGPLVPIAAGAIVFLATEVALARRGNRGALDAFALMLWCTGVALILGQTYAGGALYLGAATTAVGGAWVLGCWRRGWPLNFGLAAPITWLAVGMLFMGAYYNDLESRPAALGLALAPVLLLLGRESALWSWLRVLLVAALVAATVWWGWPPANPYAGMYG